MLTTKKQKNSFSLVVVYADYHEHPAKYQFLGPTLELLFHSREAASQHFSKLMPVLSVKLSLLTKKHKNP